MKEEIKQILYDYEVACQELSLTFAKKYFKDGYEMWLVANDPCGVCHINDRYFSILDMYEYLKYKYTSKDMFRRYDDELNNNLKKKPNFFPCIRDWKKICK